MLEEKGKIQIRIPQGAEEILDRLHGAGFEAYIVGGCVRDSVLGKTPKDWDITTSAKPMQVKGLFKRTIDTGLKHGTVTVLRKDGQYEVTTFRIDGKYEDGRHPDSVTFTGSLLEDLKRRDFTINAMAYSQETGIIDEFDGIGDLKGHVIRAVGDPHRRFEEDALRIMRAYRFSAQLDFTVEEGTDAAARDLSGRLAMVSAERIQAELDKILTSDHPGRIRDLYRVGAAAVFLPEFDACMKCPQNNPNHLWSVGEHIVRSVEVIRNDRTLRLAMLLHDIGKPEVKITDKKGIDHFPGHEEVSAQMAAGILRRLKYDNATVKKTVQLVRFHGLQQMDTKEEARRAIVLAGEECFPDLFYVQEADIAAQSDYRRAEKMASLRKREALYREIREAGDCLSLKSLSVKGADLAACGIKPGKAMGEILNAMLDDVLSAPEHNTKEYLLAGLKRGDFGAENADKP